MLHARGAIKRCLAISVQSLLINWTTGQICIPATSSFLNFLKNANKSGMTKVLTQWKKSSAYCRRSHADLDGKIVQI